MVVYCEISPHECDGSCDACPFKSKKKAKKKKSK